MYWQRAEVGLQLEQFLTAREGGGLQVSETTIPLVYPLAAVGCNDQ